MEAAGPEEPAPATESGSSSFLLLRIDSSASGPFSTWEQVTDYPCIWSPTIPARRYFHDRRRSLFCLPTGRTGMSESELKRMVDMLRGKQRELRLEAPRIDDIA